MKKLLLLALAAIMCVAVLPVSVFAAETDSYVVIDDALLTEDSLKLFTGFGCTPVLKEIDGKVVGVTMGGATSAMGYPYLRFGDESWKDYTIEFTAHGMNRVGGFVRSMDPLPQLDGYGGMCVGFEGLSSPGTFRSIYSVVNVEQNKSVIQENANGEKASFQHNLTDFNDSIRFVITIVGQDVTASMTYNDEEGKAVTQSITAKCDKFDKTQGAAGLRAVFRQVNGEQANGYFTDLKVTLLGDTAKDWKAAHPETTAAPTTDAPVVTTAAPAQPENTPATGDASVLVVVFLASAMAVAAVTLIKKKVNE